MIPFLIAVGVVVAALAALGVWVYLETRQLRRDIEASDAADAAADRALKSWAENKEGVCRSLD